ncbi:MAG: helix-turn-helix domain-containing protein [Bacteroidales bacterium]|nr:helix-turn-helix domain-containing protein [Bacteroidales bacterium]
MKRFDFNTLDAVKEVEYKDSDIAFLSDIKQRHFDKSPVSVDVFMIVLCEQGEIQVEINDIPYGIRERGMLFLKPNDLVDNCRLSPDFSGKILCLSHRIILNSFSDSDFWDQGIFFTTHRTVSIDEEDIILYNFYGKLLEAKLERSKTKFKKEVLHSLVKAVIYELLSYFESPASAYGEGLVKQSEVLFQRFIRLLSELRVKPRKVTWYAEQLCITSKHLSCVCKQTSGKTAFEWINEYVHIDIDNQLRNTNKSIKEICAYLKFPTMSFFGKYVRAYSGLSPTEYRKTLRTQSSPPSQ